MLTLGLDISSATIGWALLSEIDSNISLISYGHLKPPNKKDAGANPTSRIDFAFNEVKKLIDIHNPDTVAIEDYAKKFSRGKSNINTILLLAAFNEASGLSCYRAMNKEPVRISVNSLRSVVEKKFGESIGGKEEVLKFCKKIFTNFNTKLNRAGNIKIECYDEADAIIVAVGYFITEKNKSA